MTLKLHKVTTSKPTHPPEPIETPSIQVAIQTFAADLTDIQSFLSISFSSSRASKIKDFLTSALGSLSASFEFDSLCQNEQVDYLLLQSHIKRLLRREEAVAKKCERARELGLFGEWVDECVCFVETRHDVGRQSGREIATVFQSAVRCVDDLMQVLRSEGKFEGDKERFILFWTIAKFTELRDALEEAVGFYQGYDPVITWWIESPWESLEARLSMLVSVLGKKVGVDGSSSADDIVGDPIGREALLQELEAEWIAYSPEELIRMGEEELEWCEREMGRASKALGFDSSKDALEHVKNQFVEPGEQIHVSADSSLTTFSKHS